MKEIKEILVKFEKCELSFLRWLTVLFTISAIIYFLISYTGIEREIKNQTSLIYGIKRDVYLLNYDGDTIDVFKTNLITSDNGSSIYFEDEKHRRISLSGGIIITKEIK